MLVSVTCGIWLYGDGGREEAVRDQQIVMM